MKGEIINIILSGGSGTRLWPLSRQSNPKQFLKMFNGKSLFQHTLLRNKTIVDDFLLVTNSIQKDVAIQQSNEINCNITKIITEPLGRNTAPAIALAAFACQSNDILIISPSDHMISNENLYLDSMKRAIELAQMDNLVTFGIKPTEPNIGFGYIEHDETTVLSFREKPDLDTASEFIRKGNFLWNSGMFCFKASTYLNELRKYSPEIYESSLVAFENSNDGNIDSKLMGLIPENSIDYAVMEKSEKIKTVPSEFYWTDLGTFDAIINFHINGGIVNGIDSDNLQSNFIFSKKNVFSAVDELIIIDTEDCLLILKRNESNSVKEIFQKVKQQFPHLTS